MGSILPRARSPVIPSEAIPLPLLSFRASEPHSPSCHSERSEESWLSSNPAEPDETRRKPRRPPDHSSAQFLRGESCFSFSLMKFAAVSPCSGAACPPQAGLPAEGGLAVLFLTGCFGNSDLGLTFSEFGIFRPSKQKVPAAARTPFLPLESQHASRPPFQHQNKASTLFSF